MNTKEFVSKVNNGEIDVKSHVKESLEKFEAINNEYHYFNSFAKEDALKQAEEVSKNPKGKLAGVLVSIKDAICAKGIETRAGSKILSGYKPVFDATVVRRIKDEGGIIIGTTAQDEFGFGVFSVNVGKGMTAPLNPFDKERVCGGSSGGSAGIAQKAEVPHISLGESTGGSIVNPGSFCGVPALCPTYGRVSRNGLIDYGNSLDKIGPMGKSAYDVALMLNVIAGFDGMDSTTLPKETEDYTSYFQKDIKGLKIGVIKEGFSEDINKQVREKCFEAVNKLSKLGAVYEEVSTNLTIEYGLSSYYMLAASEASTNLAKYCGMRYGVQENMNENFNEYFSKIRSQNLGDETKRRIIIGTFARMSGVREAFYLKAAKIRTKIIEEYKNLFKKYDILISPSVPFVAPKFTETEKMTPLQNYMADVLTIGPNLAGLPHMNVNTGFVEGLPVGMTMIADHLNEGRLIQFAKEFEK
ncbi:MAG: amidase family protein [Nanoarchaeota archaeon]